MALPKGTEVPSQINPMVFFSLERDEFDAKLFESLSDGYKKLITVSPEYQEVTKPGGGISTKGKFDDMADDVPF